MRVFGYLLLPSLLFSLLHAQAPIQHPYYQQKLKESAMVHKSDLIFLGDSLTDYHDWSSFGPHHNAGIAGDTTDGILYRLHYTLDKKPKRVILMIGINDLFQGATLQEIKSNYIKIFDGLKGVDDLIILSLLPVIMEPQTELINEQVIALNHFLKKASKEYDARFIDLYRHFIDSRNGLKESYTVDGVHLSVKGYEVWEKVLHREFERE